MDERLSILDLPITEIKLSFFGSKSMPACGARLMANLLRVKNAEKLSTLRKQDHLYKWKHPICIYSLDTSFQKMDCYLDSENLRSKNEIHHRVAPTQCPVSVSYHFTRQCNKSCGLCFHVVTKSHKESLVNAVKGPGFLKEAGMRKLNFT